MPVIPESDQNRQGSAAGLLLEEPSPVVAECGVFLLRKRSAISTEQYLRYGTEASNVFSAALKLRNRPRLRVRFELNISIMVSVIIRTQVRR